MSAKKIILAMVVVASISVIINLAVYLIISMQSSQSISKHETETAQLIETQKKNYQDLIDRQENILQEEVTPVQKITPLPARGRELIYVVLTRNPSINEESINAIKDNLLSHQTQSIPSTGSFEYASYFLKQEAHQYGIMDYEPFFEIVGPYPVADLPQVGDIKNLWEKDSFGTIKLQDQFETVIKDHPLAQDPTRKIIFVYFDNQKKAYDDAYSFFDHTQFRSFALPEDRRAYVNVYNFSASKAPHVVETLVHELLHLYGASDKYEEQYEKTGRICAREGRGVILSGALAGGWIPQQTGDIMCGFVEYAENKFAPASFDDKSLIINRVTAHEIGWLK